MPHGPYPAGARRAVGTIDESFIDFSGEITMLDRLRECPLDNVIVLKSLSKCFSVPGLRLGFLYTTDHDLLARCAAEIPIWNMNSMAEFFLEVLPKHRQLPPHAHRRRPPRRGRPRRPALADHAIYVKDVSPRFPDNHGYWRIAVRLPDENHRLLTILESASEEIRGRRARAA